MYPEIAYHEAGHVFAAWLLFGPKAEPFTSITIHLRGFTSWNQEFKLRKDRESVEQLVMVMLAGGVAQELTLGGGEEQPGSRGDLIAAKQLLVDETWLADRNPESEEIAAYLRWLRLRMKGEFLKRSWRPAVDALAEALTARETIDYADAKRIVSEAWIKELSANGKPSPT